MAVMLVELYEALKEPEPQALSGAVAGPARGQVHSRAGDLWRERFVSSGAIELDDPTMRLDVDDIAA